MSDLAAGGFEPTDVMMEKPNTSYFTKCTDSLAASHLTALRCADPSTLHPGSEVATLPEFCYNC